MQASMLHQKKIVMEKLFEENTFQKIFVTLTILTFSLLTENRQRVHYFYTIIILTS